VPVEAAAADAELACEHLDADGVYPAAAQRLNVRAAWPLTMKLPDTYIGARVGIRVK